MIHRLKQLDTLNKLLVVSPLIKSAMSMGICSKLLLFGNKGLNGHVMYFLATSLIVVTIAPDFRASNLFFSVEWWSVLNSCCSNC